MISNLNQNSGSYTFQTNLEVSFKTHLPTKSPNIGFFKHSNQSFKRIHANDNTCHLKHTTLFIFFTCSSSGFSLPISCSRAGSRAAFCWISCRITWNWGWFLRKLKGLTDGESVNQWKIRKTNINLHNSLDHIPPPALGEEPVLAGMLIPLVGAAGIGAPLIGGASASGPGAWPWSLPGIPWNKKKKSGQLV